MKRLRTSKAISQDLSIAIVISIILIGSAGYFAGVMNRQTTTLTATNTFTTTSSPNATITKVIVEEQIGTASGCMAFVTLTNSTTFILPSTLNTEINAKIVTRISQTTSITTIPNTQVYTTVSNGTTYTTATCIWDSMVASNDARYASKDNRCWDRDNHSLGSSISLPEILSSLSHSIKWSTPSPSWLTVFWRVALWSHATQNYH